VLEPTIIQFYPSRSSPPLFKLRLVAKISAVGWVSISQLPIVGDSPKEDTTLLIGGWVVEPTFQT